MMILRAIHYVSQNNPMYHIHETDNMEKNVKWEEYLMSA